MVTFLNLCVSVAYVNSVFYIYMHEGKKDIMASVKDDVKACC